MPVSKTGDPHYRSAALVFGRPINGISKDDRHIGKVLNVMAAHGHLEWYAMIADLANVSENRAAELVKLYRKFVLGVEMGTGNDG